MGFKTFLNIEKIKHGTQRKRWSRSLSASSISITAGFLIAILIATAIGYNPFSVIGGLFSIGFNDPITLFYEFGVLAIAGFAFAFAARAGIFNIGISGQMLAAGTMVVLVTSVWLPPDSIPNGFGQLITLYVAVTTGALVALFIGLLESYLKVNSVVSAIILNWIIYFISFYVLSNNDPQLGGGVVVGSALISNEFRFWDPSSAVPSALPILLSVAFVGIILFLVFKYTVYGHKLKATGLSLDASKFAGYNVREIKLMAFLISGALAGLLAVILYTSGRSPAVPLSSFSDSVPVEGFNGIAIALIAFNNPIGIISISALIGLFKASVTGIFLNESASYTNFLIGFLLMGAALAVVVSEMKPILKYKAWKFGKDVLKAHDRMQSQLNTNLTKYENLYDDIKAKIQNEKISEDKKKMLLEKLNKELQEDYSKEVNFIKESFNISKIYSWIESSKLKKALAINKAKISQEIQSISDPDSKKDLTQSLGGA